MENSVGVNKMEQEKCSISFKWILFQPVVQNRGPGSHLITLEKFKSFTLQGVATN